MIHKTTRRRPAQRPAPRRKASSDAPVGDAAPRPVSITTFRLYRDQMIALQREALDRRAGGAPGRVDASALLREILDGYFKARG